MAAQSGVDIDHGLLVVDVSGESAASAAGVQPGDVIVSINGTATDDNTVLGDVIRQTGAGNVVHLEDLPRRKDDQGRRNAVDALRLTVNSDPRHPRVRSHR